jgi:hypothetical protein
LEKVFIGSLDGSARANSQRSWEPGTGAVAVIRHGFVLSSFAGDRPADAVVKAGFASKIDRRTVSRYN